MSLTIIASAVEWAVSIANDDTHGYDQSSRWGPNYDCSSLLIQAYENAGVPVKTNGASYTGNMVKVFKKCGFQDVTANVNLKTGDGLIKGDVLWVKGHTEMCIGDGKIVGAHINEKGSTTGGVSGDQTQNEISVKNYYNKPWTTVLRYPSGNFTGVTKEDVVSGNRYLTLSEMEVNAKYIYQYLYQFGWSINSIAGMLGNMQRESTINPAIWQSLNEGDTSGGYGLVQWTPATKYLDWCEEQGLTPSDMDSNLLRILYELENGLQWDSSLSIPKISFEEFTKSNLSPEQLARVFLANYEKAGVTATEERETNARYWYEFLLDYQPIFEGEDDFKKRDHLPLLMMYLATKRV